ncbi:metallophosphoesterase, family [Limihaloglobus sulfuriphilus]|uniref:Metallophosphoesterase, family n=1 Tax=Limihaloglobus sulfuriphilus TaxID=1851148 RepID=A0A1Q2MBF4_9BACT|nr:metallophosphoesterase [Limihaloglobus sulfuriphilus]AQQ69990.1 metallophosphoesterase, family [Limihaloglobus sulfuriphilus]
MDRRCFMKVYGAGMAAALLPSGAWAMAGKQSDVLRGFIVSDAHFGWDGGDQPRISEQREAMRNIVSTFGKLDLMIDTGDAYHGNLKGDVRGKSAGDWTDIISGETGSLPMLYVPGNHEIMGWREGDPEWRCNRLGSLPCRPYYSFDIKGIHFVSVPELMMAVYVNKETIEWLKLDLEVNRDKTVILLSHNNISGTTTPDEEGYRGLVNSAELYDIIKANPNIIAWMHGHNHNYQIVQKDNCMYVSNGRIGGFDPSNGQYGIGGIYFELSNNLLDVKCYSAQFKRFLGPDDGPQLAGRMKAKTSLDPAKPMAYSFGTGGARDTERIPMVNHYTSKSESAKLYITGADDEIINEDTTLSYYQCRPSNTHMQLFGFIVRDPQKLWRWDDPGITLFKRSDGKDIRVTAPHYGAGMCSYYRCPPDQEYEVTLELEGSGQGPKLDIEFMYFDRTGKYLESKHAPLYDIKAGKQKVVYSGIASKPTKAVTIYDDPDEHNILNFIVQCIFTDMTSEVKVKSFELRFKGAHGATVDPAVIIDGRRYSRKGTLKQGELAEFDIPLLKNKSQQTYQLSAGGNRRLSWLIKYDHLDWQLRNAAAADMGEYIQIDGLRNQWSHEKEILFAPMAATDEPFVSRLRGITKARIYPVDRGSKNLKVKIEECYPGIKPIVFVRSDNKPASVSASEGFSYKNGIIEITVKKGETIDVIL